MYVVFVVGCDCRIAGCTYFVNVVVSLQNVYLMEIVGRNDICTWRWCYVYWLLVCVVVFSRLTFINLMSLMANHRLESAFCFVVTLSQCDLELW